MYILLALLDNLFGHFLQVVASLERNELNEHRKVDSRDNLNLVILQKSKD
jgi:hypothetical protein